MTHQGGRQLERVVNLLSPNKMRARRIVLRAYIFYALALLLIYFFMCAYAELLPQLGGPDLSGNAIGANEIPLTGAEAAQATTGFNPADPAGDQQLSDDTNPASAESRLGINPSVSLTVALIIVGLAPGFPALQRVEGWIRLTAHRFAGIPTWVIGASEDLGRNAVSILPAGENRIPTDRLLIPQGSWERILQYQIGARRQLSAPDEFRHDLEIIFAAAAWILDRKLKLAKSDERRDFEALENSLRQRIGAFIQQLDEKSGYRPGQETSFSPEDDGPDDDTRLVELQRESWERLAREAADLANDLHILLALYVEHEIIAPDPAKTSARAGGKDIARQRILARRKLQDFLGAMLAERSAVGGLPLTTMTVWCWTIPVVLVVALVWSILPGRFETALQFGYERNAYFRAISYVLSAFNQYCIPILVALTIRDGALESDRWNRIWASHWTTTLPQAVVVIGMSWAVAALLIVGLGLWQSGVTEGFGANAQAAWASLGYIFEYNAPSAFRGAVLAWIVLCLLDRSLSDDPDHIGSSLSWALRAAAIMALCGALTRYAMSVAAQVRSNRPALDQIDYGLICYAAIFSGLIGFVVLLCLSEAIRSARTGGASRLSVNLRPKAQIPAPPPAGE